MRFTRRTCLHLLAGLVCCAAPAAALGQSVPQPIRYDQYPGLELCLETCAYTCLLGVGYTACWGACQAGLGTCDAGCDVVCFFAPSSAACSDCLSECATQRAICEGNCEGALQECNQACAATCIPQYTNSVGTPWFVGDTVYMPDPVSGVQHRFGTLNYPYEHLWQVIREWDANPKTIYIESGSTYAGNGSPFVINHPTWLINNTPSNGPVLIQP